MEGINPKDIKVDTNWGKMEFITNLYQILILNGTTFKLFLIA